MKRHRLAILLPLLGATGWFATCTGVAATHVHAVAVDLDVPDHVSTGVASTTSVDLPGATVSTLQVHLKIDPAAGQTAHLGDLYAFVRHEDRIAVLLNRPGREAERRFGYGDSQGLAVTFADGAPDVHHYRPDANVPLSGALLGTFGPDARASDPALVLGSDPRSLSLGAFAGMPASGSWTLFVADLSGGGVHRWLGWELHFATAPIPEPEVWLGGSLLALWSVWRDRFRRR